MYESESYIRHMKEWASNLQQQLKIAGSNIKPEQFVRLEDQLRSFQQLLHRQTDLKENVIYDEALQIYESFRSLFDASFVPIGGHTLPPLPYAYDALKPYIKEEIMRLHHDKHHKSYVDGLNKAEVEMEKARKTKDFSLIKHWEREVSFNGAGHYLHTIFWNVMSPNGGGKPKGPLLSVINDAFGSFEQMKAHFSEAANAVEGSGWAILVWSPRAHRLEILQAEKHQNLSQWDIIPLLVLDVWEHAYYLQYKNDRKKYIHNWWNIVNWREVEKRFHEAKKVKWKPF
ncbi:superoxide dismutase [Bacillus sp. FJAT-47783]|uniref:superoxide dismutase n=1 Tax=Bacillus sp. FJAT-47783 TaxID=2922712 RepID=UPI001FAC61A6|nr:superoxide dismutase [Bacillus sp. FJAT-47783]